MSFVKAEKSRLLLSLFGLGLALFLLVKPGFVFAAVSIDEAAQAKQWILRYMDSATTQQKDEVYSIYNSMDPNKSYTKDELKGIIDGMTTIDSKTKNDVKYALDLAASESGQNTITKSQMQSLFNLATYSGESSDSDTISGQVESTTGSEIDEVTWELLVAQCVTMVFLVVAFYVYLIVDIVLVGRVVMIAILAVLSPLPFILMILPATRKYAQMWWQKFIKWALVGVLITFFLWLVPKILATKNTMGHWETKKVTAILPDLGITGSALGTGYNPFAELNVIYPKLLGGNMSGADFMEGFITFLLAVGFMIAAAWVAVTLGGTAGKIALSIPKLAKNVAKRAGKRVGKEAWKASGVPGGAKQMWGEKMAPGRKTREAKVAEALGVRGAKARDFSERTRKFQDEIKEAGATAEQSREILAQGWLPDGTKLDKYGAVAHLVNTASDIENYEDYVAAQNRIENLGGGEIELEQLRQGVDPFARYNIAGGEFEEFQNDLVRGKLKVDDLKNSRALENERAVSFIAEKFGPGAIKKLETPINKGDLQRTLMRITTSPSMTDLADPKTRAAAALVTEDVEKSFKIAGTDRFATGSLRDFITKTTDPIALGKLKVSAGVADQFHKHLTPNQLEALNADSFGNVSRVIKRDMDKLKDIHKVEELEDLAPENLKGTGYSFDLFNYIKKNKGKFNLR